MKKKKWLETWGGDLINYLTMAIMALLLAIAVSLPFLGDIF